MAEKALTTYDDDIMSTVPQVLMVILGLALLMAILPVTQMAQAQAYQGRNDPRTVPVTHILSSLDLITGFPYQAWMIAYFINDGPDPVEIAINYPDERFTINPLETVSVNRSGAQERIKVIFFQCAPGRSATVRVTGEY